MRKLIAFLLLATAVALTMSGCASSGKHVKDTIDNVYYYGLFGDEYTTWW
jgi:uncharacterized protein YceK